MVILITTSTYDFGPSEVGIPWKILHDAGHNIRFATDTGNVGICDQRMLNDQAFQSPISYGDINVGDYDGLLLPGGDAKGIIPYLEPPVFA